MLDSINLYQNIFPCVIIIFFFVGVGIILCGLLSRTYHLLIKKKKIRIKKTAAYLYCGVSMMILSYILDYVAGYNNPDYDYVLIDPKLFKYYIIPFVLFFIAILKGDDGNEK